MVPAEVNLIVEKDNASLAKEIEDVKNEKLIKEIRDLYSSRINECK